LAAGTTLSLLALPASAEVHFVLLAIPLALLKLRPLEFAVVAALMIVPLEITAERFTAGMVGVAVVSAPLCRVAALGGVDSTATAQ
jgi:hypothetical protein